MIVVDTSVLIDLLRGHSGAANWWVEVRGLVASELSRAELLRGMRSHERARTVAVFDSVEWHDVDAAVSQRAGVLGRQYRRSHQGIDAIDLCIAATAQLLDADVATTNVRHFPMFEGLEPPY